MSLSEYEFIVLRMQDEIELVKNNVRMTAQLCGCSLEDVIKRMEPGGRELFECTSRQLAEHFAFQEYGHLLPRSTYLRKKTTNFINNGTINLTLIKIKNLNISLNHLG